MVVFIVTSSVMVDAVDIPLPHHFQTITECLKITRYYFAFANQPCCACRVAASSNKALHLTAIPLRSIASRLCGAFASALEFQHPLEE